MSSNLYTQALTNTLAELQNTCPDILHAIIFKDNTLIAKTENTNETAANNTINAFQTIAERADAIGGLQATTIQAANGKINISCINDYHMATILSKTADEKYINALTRTLIPIVIKLVDNIPAPQEPAPTELELPEEIEQTEQTEQTEAAAQAEAEQATTTEQLEPLQQAEPAEQKEETETPRGEGKDEEDDSSTSTTKPPVTQLIVETLSGILVRGDTVQIDKSLIEDWNELYGEDKIKEVHIEALNGKTTRCKFKPIKDSKQEGKGIIKLPEKIQITLEATQGDLVMVKPVVE
ncbi:MAG: hypothetical protein QXJ76_04000 [Candidatus Bathyarchaeia archaeon]